MTEMNTTPQYTSLSDLRLRKEEIRKDICADDAKIKTLWNSIFTMPDGLSATASPSKRITALLSVSATAFDGALFAWKLYRKFKRKR